MPYHERVLTLVCLSDPPGEYRVVETEEAAYSTPRFFTLAAPAALAQQIANTHLRAVRVMSCVAGISENGAVYEPQKADELDERMKGSPRIVPRR